jgi:probable HAF family extracellular repeat protein
MRRPLFIGIGPGFAVTLALSVAPVPSDAITFNFTTFDVPGALTLTEASGINDTGDIVGTYNTSTANVGFLLDKHGNLTTFNALGSDDTIAEGINNAGQVVGHFFDHGFLREPDGTVTSFDAPGPEPHTIIPYGINDSGQISGTLANPVQGFVKDGSTVTAFDVPGGTDTNARGLNNAGDVVGTFTDGTGERNEGFLKEGGTFVTIDIAGASSIVAFGINDHEQIVGDFSDTAGTAHGFFYDGGDITPFDVPGAAFTQAEGINNRGEVVGMFGDQDGIRHAFIATPIAEPKSLLLLAAAFVGIGLARRRPRLGPQAKERMILATYWTNVTLTEHRLIGSRDRSTESRRRLPPRRPKGNFFAPKLSWIH